MVAVSNSSEIAIKANAADVVEITSAVLTSVKQAVFTLSEYGFLVDGEFKYSGNPTLTFHYEADLAKAASYGVLSNGTMSFECSLTQIEGNADYFSGVTYSESEYPCYATCASVSVSISGFSLDVSNKTMAFRAVFSDIGASSGVISFSISYSLCLNCSSSSGYAAYYEDRNNARFQSSVRCVI